MNDELLLPESLRHIGFIVDGNRRWAKQRGLPSLEGHRKGLKKVEETIDFYSKLKLPFLSFFLFSTENWHRSTDEVEYLMNLLRAMSKKFKSKAKEYDIRIKVLGADDPLPEDIQNSLRELELSTKDNAGTTVCLCINYGGRAEISDAASRILQDFADGKLEFKKQNDGPMPKITSEMFEKYIYQPDVPSLDLMVRTSGEQRISGFMLWRSAYAEFLFLDKYFPDLEQADLKDILVEFQSRSRRFGR